MTNSQNTSNSSVKLLQSLSIAKPLYKYAISAFAIIAVVALLWSLFGSIPQRIVGIGEINSANGLSIVTTPYSGQIKKSLVNINDTVVSGDLLFVIDQPEMRDAIKEIQSNIIELTLKDSILSTSYQQSLSIKQGMDVLGTESLVDRIRETDKTISFYQTKLKEEKNLYEDGLITYSQYFETQNALANANIEKTSLEEELAQISLNSQEWLLGKTLTESDIKSQLEILNLELKNIKDEYALKTEIRSTVSGTIVQIGVSEGDVIGPGIQLAIIENPFDSCNYIVNLFVPYYSNSVIKKGMEVDIEPFAIDYNLYGWIKGTVIEVESYVSSDYSLMKTLKNEELVGLVQEDGAVIKIVVQLNKDPNTVSGFEWTNNKGTPYKISPGMLSRGYVIVKDKAPIDYLIPIFKEYFD